MHSPGRAVSVAALVLIAAAPLRAQDDVGFQQGRLMFSIGGGAASAGVSCTPKCSADRVAGPALLVRGGSQISPQFNVTLEMDFFRRDFKSDNGDDARWTMSWYLLGMQWFPNVEETFFLTVGAGLGIARANVTFPQVGPLPLYASDVGLMLGIGKDFYFREDMAFTAYLSYLTTSRTSAQIGRADSGAKMSADLVKAGLAFTIF
jgi:hypothetical protein